MTQLDEPDWIAATRSEAHAAAAQADTLAEGLAQAGNGQPAELVPYDLAALMRKGVQPPARIADWLYAGGLTALNSEPGAGKTWLAIWLALTTISEGGHVVYLDEEGGPELVTERLCALGAEPDTIEANLTYIPFPNRRWDAADLEALTTRTTDRTQLVVFDSLPDFLALAGRDEDKATQVTEWVNRVCGTLRRRNIAQLVLDHLPKPAAGEKVKRSRYSRGSGSKLAKADGTLLLETVTEFDADHSGQLHLWKTKDRRGRLPLPMLGKTPITLDVAVTDGQLTITTAAPNERPTWDGPTECMGAVLGLMKGSPEIINGTELVRRMKAAGHAFRETTVREAADRLVNEGRLSGRPGPRNSRLYTWQPDHNTSEEPLDEDF